MATSRSRPQPGAGLHLPKNVTASLQQDLSAVAEEVVAAIVAEIPSYSEPFRGKMGRNIENAVEIALGGFLELASSRQGFDLTTRVESVFEAAYALGRGEARSGRTIDALTSAYRVGARTAWRDLSAVAVEAGLPAAETARFAELVFDYIDQLSQASVSGHADELETTGRIRERRREELAQKILANLEPEALEEAAERAGWVPPRTLTAVVLPSSMAGSARAMLDARTLSSGEDVTGVEMLGRGTAARMGGSGGGDRSVLLVPDAEGAARRALLHSMRGRDAVVGPPRPWTRASTSLQRAVQARSLGPLLAAGASRGAGDGDRGEGAALDSEDHLAALVLTANPEALADLRERVLAPFSELKPVAAEKLTTTLRSWLFHHGRRDDVARELFVHPQTVRYRMGQVRELYGDHLEDPAAVLELTVALAVDPPEDLPGGPEADRSGDDPERGSAAAYR